MLERSEKILKLTCLVLAAAMLYQLSHLMLAKSPVTGLVIPALPTLAAAKDSKAPDGKPVAIVSAAPGRGTNLPATTPKGTNDAGSTGTGKAETNAVPAAIETVVRGTNSAPVIPSTNSVVAAKSTNSAAASNSSPVTLAMNNAAAGIPPARGAAGARGRAGGPRGGGGPGAPANVPAEVRPFLDKIVQSEVLGAVVHPVPMALLGIAGDQIILRAPNGQTGLVKVGAELGGIKLIRIDVNRVLIEENGQQRELTLFSGVGSKALEPKPKSNANETNK